MTVSSEQTLYLQKELYRCFWLLIAATLAVATLNSYHPALNQNSIKLSKDVLRPPKQDINCNQMVQLQNFTYSNVETHQVFFLETSGRPFLSGRQSCSIESAARNSQLTSKVIFMSSFLNLSTSYSFCQLYHAYRNVEFYTINYEKLFEDTPVEGILSRIELAASHKLTHLSDIARKALVFKYGGFYLDLDVLVLKSLKRLTNVYPLELRTRRSKLKNCFVEANGQKTKLLNNGQFHLVAKHELAREALYLINKTYNPKSDSRVQCGPGTSGKALMQLYRLPHVSNSHIASNIGLELVISK